MLRSKGVTDEEMLARLLAASTPTAAAAVFARMGCKHAAAVLQLLAGKEKGAAAVAALLQCLSPVVAARWVFVPPIPVTVAVSIHGSGPCTRTGQSWANEPGNLHLRTIARLD
jgi:hypothetical protein